MKIQWLKQVNHFFYRHYGAMYQFFAVFSYMYHLVMTNIAMENHHAINR